MDLFDLAERQHAAFTRDQARVLGVTDDRLKVLLRHGVVTRVAPSTFLVRGHPPTWRQRLHVATLSLPGSMATARAGVWLHGLDGIDVAPIELLAERGGHRRTAPRAVLLHETKDLRGVDVDEVDGIPCTSVVRTLIDLAAVAHPFRVGMALDSALRRDESLLPVLVERHLQLARRGRGGTVAMRALLAERSDGNVVDSGFERRALRLIAGSDLPAPVTQHPVSDGDFRCWIDIAWPDRMVAVECDSLRHHLSERAFRWERVRRRRLIALGWTVLEFTYREVTEQGPMVLRELRHHVLPSG